jgi:hypothetical protein
VAWGQFELDGSRLDNNKPEGKRGSRGNSKIESGKVYLKILKK